MNRIFSLVLVQAVPAARCGGGGGAGGRQRRHARRRSPCSPPTSAWSVGQPATFTVTASGAAPLSYQWQKNATAIAGATASSYTTPATAAADNGSTFQVVVAQSGRQHHQQQRDAHGGRGNRAWRRGTDVTTYKNDLNRSGQNLAESTLTPANVASATFGLLRTFCRWTAGSTRSRCICPHLSAAGRYVQYGVRRHRARFGIRLRCGYGRAALACFAARHGRDPER